MFDYLRRETVEALTHVQGHEVPHLGPHLGVDIGVTATQTVAVHSHVTLVSSSGARTHNTGLLFADTVVSLLSFRQGMKTQRRQNDTQISRKPSVFLHVPYIRIREPRNRLKSGLVL
jgi:hypothetical protein